MENSNRPPRPRQRNRVGSYILLGLLVAALCVGIILYIGWFNDKTHVDSPNGDNVMADYPIDMPNADAPGVNDWQNPDHTPLRQVIVDHAEGTDVAP